MVRVCPKRDAICPHGMGCKFTIDRYQCADETNPMTDTPTNTGAALPCPFCGRPATARERYNGTLEVGCSGPRECPGTDVFVSIAAWNRRAAAPTPPGGKVFSVEPNDLTAGERTQGPCPAPSSKGPVELLCHEIDFDFDKRLERPDVLRAFVKELVDVIEDRRDMQEAISGYGGKAPSDGSLEVLHLARAMVAFDKVPGMVAASKLVHSACHRLNPDDAYPTDHLIDMLSSCASAIRFGFEVPCRSRHAAEAANHIWQQVYGVSLLDRHSPAWGKDWARAKLQSAIISLLPDGAERVHAQAEAEVSSEQKNLSDHPVTEEGKP